MSDLNSADSSSTLGGDHARTEAIQARYRAVVANFAQLLAKIVNEDRLTSERAAERCGIDESRVRDLLEGRAQHFTVESLLNIATKLGRRVRFTIEAA